MSEGPHFRSPMEELQHLYQEIAEIKASLRDIAARLSQIERHARRAFGDTKLPGSTDFRASKHPRGSDVEIPTISPLEALKLFEELTKVWREQGGYPVEERLSQMNVADLKLIAHELGVSLPSKPSRKSLYSGIVGRINESIMLSKNTNIMAPRSAELPQEGQGANSHGSQSNS